MSNANAPKCPLRYGEPCTLCQPYVTGPEDCQTVALVMSDPELKAQWAKGYSAWARQRREERKKAHKAAEPTGAPASPPSQGLVTGMPASW
ncbi:DUF6767 domain-containing protein [Ancrocorticia populi]|uniref:Uncharacterized protein n=1 Tax=Ancrocorticia populi TaxID=2175228 RepID=A0A2V1K5T6_9ACTO|nr:DUF6767 domain-containing protein [Ancrocorticia populi]PWF26677.1 hypothetical protein DD236_05145 [Ancrocorticia populi]